MQDDPDLILAIQFMQDVACAIGGTIIDDDDLIRQILGLHSPEDFPDVIGFVINGDDDR
jgi:hypothetical protein